MGTHQKKMGTNQKFMGTIQYIVGNPVRPGTSSVLASVISIFTSVSGGERQRGNGRAGSSNKVVFPWFFVMKMDVMRAGHVHIL